VFQVSLFSLGIHKVNKAYFRENLFQAGCFKEEDFDKKTRLKTGVKQHLKTPKLCSVHCLMSRAVSNSCLEAKGGDTLQKTHSKTSLNPLKIDLKPLQQQQQQQQHKQRTFTAF